MNESHQLFNSFKDYVNNFSELNEVSIFGAGSYGKKVYDICLEKKIKVNFFFGNNIKLFGTKIDGVEILNPIEITGDDSIIIASTWSNEVLEQLENNKIRPVFYIVDPWGEIFDTKILDLDIEKIEYLYDNLNDEESKKVLKNIIQSRMNKNKFKESDYEQYIHPELTFNDDDIIIDGGAFNGDTIRMLNKHVLVDGLKIYSFEPDEKNYLSLVNEATQSRYKEYAKKLGLYSTDSILKFLSTNEIIGYGCRIEEDGDIIIKTTSLDNYCEKNNFIPTYIKLDVEGTEKEVILGASNIIKKYKPKLAISLYHKYKDLWELPYLLNEISKEYRFYLGHHRKNWMETILYALPKGV
jgi:FkbM family methyltransferase